VKTPLIVVTRSENRKLSDGRVGVAATYRQVGPTCPQNCSLLNHGCYAQRHHVARLQRRSRKRHDSLDVIAETDTRLVRHHVSGDFYRAGDKLDVPYLESVLRFHWMNPTIQGWTYTHRWRDLHVAGYKPKTFPRNLAILASCDTLKDARAAQRAGWITARVIDKKSDRKKLEAVCRFQIDKTPCSKCKLCWTPHENLKSIAFIKH
jgi:hypothetical protein